MKIRKSVLLVIIGLMVLSFDVNAMTKENAEKTIKEIDSIVTNNEDGSCSYVAKSIDYDVLSKNVCEISMDEFKERYPGMVSYMSNEELDEAHKDFISSCKKIVSTLEVRARLNKKGMEYWDGEIEKVSSNELVFKRAYYNEEGQLAYLEKKCNVEFSGDEKTLNKVQNVTKKLKIEYKINGLNALNSIYHYGPVEANISNPGVLLYRFPEFKELILKNDEFSYDIAWDGWGSAPDGSGSGGYVIISKDGIIYDMKYVNFSFGHIFPVDKDSEGTVYEKAAKRIKEFLGEDVSVSVTDDGLEIDKEDNDNILNEALGTKDVHYVGYGANVLVGGNESRLLIVEVDKKLVDKYEVKAFDNKSGVNIYSNSSDVPGDATLDVENVKDKDYVVKAVDFNKYSIIDAFDIAVVKTGNGKFVTTIDGGIDVYIPVSGKKKGDKVVVHHIKEEGSLGDKFDGEIVEVDGVLYAKFTTTHFSTYAVLGDAAGVEIPDTGDSIITSMIIFGISIVGLFGVVGYNIYRKKKLD